MNKPDLAALQQWLEQQLVDAEERQKSAVGFDQVFLAGQKQALARVITKLRKDNA